MRGFFKKTQKHTKHLNDNFRIFSDDFLSFIDAFPRVFFFSFKNYCIDNNDL